MKNNCSVKCFPLWLPNFTRTIPAIMPGEVEIKSHSYFIALCSVSAILLKNMVCSSLLPSKVFKTALFGGITNSLAVNVNFLIPISYN